MAGCYYTARIKPRQKCSCRGIARPCHRNEAGGIYDDDPPVAMAEELSRNPA